MGVYDHSLTPASNTTISGIDIDENNLPSTMNNALRQHLSDVLAVINDAGAKATTTGAADVQVLATESSIQALADGVILGFIAGYTNTGAATLNVDTLGAKAVVKAAGSALAAGDLIAGAAYLVVYDASQGSGSWMLLNASTVTTNANLTGHVTSTGNAAILGAFTTAQLNTALSDQSLYGQETIWVPAGAMEPRATTAPATSNVVEIATSLIALRTMDFATGADDFATFGPIKMPKNWDAGTLVCEIEWSTDGSQTAGLDGVKWFVRLGCYASSAQLRTALGTAVGPAAQDHSATADDIMTTAEFTVTAANAAAETIMYGEVYRDVSDAGDDLDIDARLHGVRVHYTTNALNDS